MNAAARASMDAAGGAFAEVVDVVGLYAWCCGLNAAARALLLLLPEGEGMCCIWFRWLLLLF